MTWQLRVRPYELELRHRFTVAGSSRTATPAVSVELERDGIIGFGEAAFPPYLAETQETAAAFLRSVELGGGFDLARCRDATHRGDLLRDIDALSPGNHAAKAALDIALHDWLGKSLGQPLYRLFGLDPQDAPKTSYTLGIDDPEVMRARAREAGRSFARLKIKLGGAHDRAAIEAVADATDARIQVDVNQGWHDRVAALETIEWLATRGVDLVEQPMPKERVEDLAWLRERSPLPIVGDEGVQRLADVAEAKGVYDAINVKLVKCTGIHEARSMIELARELGLSVMLGCMTESSCGIAAAVHLSALADWADLDGALLVANDPFTGLDLRDGRIVPSDGPGLGIALRARGG